MKNWLWVIYPVIVAIFILYTAVGVLSNSDKWLELTQKREDAAQSEIKVAELRKRLSVLSNFDKEAASAQLKEMLEVMPSNRQAWSLIMEIKNAAAQSEVELKEYKSNAGNVKAATAGAVLTDESGVVLTLSARVPDVVRLRRFTNVLLTQKPLVRLLRLSFDGGAMTLTVEGGWARMMQQAAKDQSLPESDQTIADLRTRMEKFTLVSVDQIASMSGDLGVTNPF